MIFGRSFGLAGQGQEKWFVNEIALTALDLRNEVHVTHHPVPSAKYYEDHKDIALLKANEVRTTRIPKFFSYFERALKGNAKGNGRYLVGDKLTYADTTLWHLLESCHHAFPKEYEAISEDYPVLLGTFRNGVRDEEGIKKYLESDKRIKFHRGVFKYYAELDHSS